ncbi:hypothetical protein PDE_05656 [Penicillium oxalicum 114-2]|uniref:BZIP domain-containing protein n=1 Tax=Penicillium oxalicum (strain 114-2 / CGMCC 5302) TaxID=933388 RepID=S7ZK77_PENO1|nr:hypothetical protein PDE_05656 [Penicillium oxalicum 114-2]
MAPVKAVIPLARMPQQATVQTQEEDWTGITDRTERRKLQNRLNQRALRLRKRRSKAQNNHQNGAIRSPSIPSPNLGPWSSCTSLTTEGIDYSASSLNLEHLLTLPKINVHRAIVENICSVGMTMDWMKEENSISIFNLTMPVSVFVPGLVESSIPLDMQPTAVQRKVPHHPWLDFFPSPTLRDNLIILQDQIDDDELCHDLMAFWDTRNQRAGLLVWGPPWLTSSWEVTETFLAKWGFLLYGCTTLLMSTNFWRLQRGEKPLLLRSKRQGWISSSLP